VAVSPSSRPDPLARVVELLAAGAWREAHEIVQKEDSTLAAWLHGIAHTVEGDLNNARYWYRKAERAFPGPDSVKAEIAAARRMLKGGPEPDRS
jgi:fructose-specific component phosphotransferase system IIB-like protein